MRIKKVGIVGAGVSGLIACKYMKQKGFEPIVFEASNSIGGIWTQTISSTTLQTPRFTYEFVDFPWPKHVKEDYPDHNQVLQYLESYAKHFGLFEHIRLNCKVMGVDRVVVGAAASTASSEEELLSWSLWGGTGKAFSNEEGTWHISVQDTLIGSTYVFEVDFMILCLGRFSDVPNFPAFPPNKGPEVFQGKVLHSMEYSCMPDSHARALVAGKRVAVVGFQKSALDIAAECANVNGSKLPCTLLYRKPQWNLPAYNIWGINLAFLYLSRFSELMVHKPGEGHLLALLASLLSPLRWLRSKFVESYLKWKLPLKKHSMVPDHSFEQQISSCRIALLPKDFYSKVEKGHIMLKKVSNWSFTEKGIVCDSNGIVNEVELVILATGYRGDEKIKNIFTSPLLQKVVMGSESSTLGLYRECIHRRIPQAAIIGYSESLSNLHTSEMRIRWLAEFMDGRVQIPSIRGMEEDTKKWEKYMKENSGSHFRKSCIGAIHIRYNDQLCQDMGYRPRRKGSWFEEFFIPYLAKDYAGL